MTQEVLELVRNSYIPTMEYSIKINQSVRILIFNLITNQCPFISILNLDGKFMGNIWLNSLSSFNIAPDISESIESYLNRNPDIIETSHFLSVDRKLDLKSFSTEKEVIFPVVDDSNTYLGYINLQKISFDKFYNKLNIVNKNSLTHILIVEDEEDLLHSLNEWLGGLNYICTLASNGVEALKALNENPHIQLVLTDIKMPEMDGKELIQAIRENNTKIPIIVLSGYGARAEVIDCLKLGANDFLDKPFELDLLEHAIKKREKSISLDNKEKTYSKIQTILSDTGIILSETGIDLSTKLAKLVNSISESLYCQCVSFVTYQKDYWHVLASTNSAIHDTQITLESAKILEYLRERPRVFLTNSSEEISFLKPYNPQQYYKTNSSMIFPVFRKDQLYAFLCCSDKNSNIGFQHEDSYIAKSIINPLSYLIDYACIQIEIQTLNKNLEMKATHMADEVLKLKKETEFQSRLALIGETASSIAHDIKNPLTIALGSLEFIKLKFDLDKDIEDKLAKALKAMTNISRITDTITRMSHRDVVNTSFELKNAVESTLIMLDMKLKQHKIDMRIPKFQSYKVRGNQVQIEQVLINLISNAIDALKKNKTKTIILNIEDKDQECIDISLFDNGPGIPLEKEQSVFQKWFTTKEVGEGTGLGLHICQKIIESHLSELKYSRTTDNMSSFSFQLKKVF